MKENILRGNQTTHLASFSVLLLVLILPLAGRTHLLRICRPTNKGDLNTTFI
jgi:hypothetical protein